MNRLNRAFAVVLLSVLSMTAFAPAAQALSSRKPPLPRVTAGDWLNAALGWLSHVLVGDPQAPPAEPVQKKAPTTGGSAGTVGPTATNCIDPLGTEVCQS